MLENCDPQRWNAGILSSSKSHHVTYAKFCSFPCGHLHCQHFLNILLSYFLCFLVFFCFVWNRFSLGNHGWPRIHSDPYASVFDVFGLKTYAIISSFVIWVLIASLVQDSMEMVSYFITVFLVLLCDSKMTRQSF